MAREFCQVCNKWLAGPCRAHSKRCPDCDGDGWNSLVAGRDDSTQVTCTTCKGSGKNPAVVIPKRSIVIGGDSITVANLAYKMNVKVGDVMKKLMARGVMATMNHHIDRDLAVSVAYEFDWLVHGSELPLSRDQVLADLRRAVTSAFPDRAEALLAEVELAFRSRAEILEEAARVTESAPAGMQGCSDGNCIIRRPTGMATNGGCRCADVRLRRKLAWLPNAIRELK